MRRWRPTIYASKMKKSLAILGFGRSPAEHFAAYLAAPALLGLAGQIAFALLPLLQSVLDRGAAGWQDTSAG